jgi:hypothetical protein
MGRHLFILVINGLGLLRVDIFLRKSDNLLMFIIIVGFLLFIIALAIDKVVGDKYRVLGKVRLADIIKTKSGLGPQDRRTAFNQIQSKHVDFVLCDPSDLSVKLVVELDDSSHDAEDRQSRDKFVDKALDSAGIKVVRVKARKSYSLLEVEKLVMRTEEPNKIKKERWS